jgi:mRNA interferase HigB
MHVVTRKHLFDAVKAFPDAAKQLQAWATIVENARWKNIAEVRQMFKDADYVDGYVVFNILGNRYRLIAYIHYAKNKPKITSGHVYIRSVLTHADYNDKKKWDPYKVK